MGEKEAGNKPIFCVNWEKLFSMLVDWFYRFIGSMDVIFLFSQLFRNEWIMASKRIRLLVYSTERPM